LGDSAYYGYGLVDAEVAVTPLPEEPEEEEDTI
jgi:hypothetical protein